jgi:anaerobic ribonucleoside-triphosphate reductase
MVFIQKRDGSTVPFNKQKIINAINKAFLEVDKKLYEDDTAKDIAEEIYHRAENFYIHNPKIDSHMNLSDVTKIVTKTFSVEDI